MLGWVLFCCAGGQDDTTALGLSACRQCWSPNCPLLTQVQGQPGRRRREGLRAGAGPGPGSPSVLYRCPAAVCWDWALLV